MELKMFGVTFHEHIKNKTLGQMSGLKNIVMVLEKGKSLGGTRCSPY